MTIKHFRNENFPRLIPLVRWKEKERDGIEGLEKKTRESTFS